MLIGLCSVKGSPGVTTTALALASCWPTANPIVMEADPAGGDLATRFRLPLTPGTVSFAAEARRNAHPGLLDTHSQLLPSDVRVVVGPVADDQASAALDVLARRGRQALTPIIGHPTSVVLVDAGRIHPSSPALPLLRGADAIVVVARPWADELTHVATMLSVVPDWTHAPSLVLVGDGHPRSEVEQALQIPVLGVLPHDPRTAEVLCGRRVGRRLDRSSLGRAAQRLAQALLRVTLPAERERSDQDEPDQLAVSDSVESTERGGRLA